MDAVTTSDIAGGERERMTASDIDDALAADVGPLPNYKAM
jgi:hypothetical protein